MKLINTTIVNERLADRGIRVVSGYVNTKTKATFEDADGKQWEATPHSVMQGSGSPHQDINK